MTFQPAPKFILALVSMGLLLSTLAFVGAAPVQEAPANTLLVLNKTDNTMSIVDAATMRELGRVPTGNGPHEAVTSPDGRLVYVANYGTGPAPGNSISVIDIAARKELRRIDLGPLTRPHGLYLHDGKVYFTAEGARAVGRYNPELLRVDWVMGTGQNVSHMIVVTPDGAKAYVTNMGSQSVTSIDLHPVPGQPGIRHIKVGNVPEAIDVSPDGREIWVGNRSDGTVSIIEVASDQVTHTTEKISAFPIRVKFTPDGKHVLVSDAQAGELLVLDAQQRSVTRRLKVGGQPIGVQIAGPDRAFVADSQGNRVVAVDMKTWQLAGEVATGENPDGLAWAGD